MTPYFGGKRKAEIFELPDSDDEWEDLDPSVFTRTKAPKAKKVKKEPKKAKKAPKAPSTPKKPKAKAPKKVPKAPKKAPRKSKAGLCEWCQLADPTSERPLGHRGPHVKGASRLKEVAMRALMGDDEKPWNPPTPKVVRRKKAEKKAKALVPLARNAAAAFPPSFAPFMGAVQKFGHVAQASSSSSWKSTIAFKSNDASFFYQFESGR